MLERIEGEALELVRFVFADQHGLVRGKTLVAGQAAEALRSGVGFVGTNLLKDSSDRTAWPVFTPGAGLGSREFEGAADVILVADPSTFKVLPWAERTGWVQCQAYFADGRPVPFDTRHVLRTQLARLADAGYEAVIGLEVEFHVYRVTDPRLAPSDSGWPGRPPEVDLINPGYRLLAEQRFDQFAPVLELLRVPLQALGLPLRTMEIELGPSQVEFVFGALPALEAADAMLLFRNATKQILRRHGYHATFMCRPGLPDVMSSGWHLHQSLRRQGDGANVFVPPAVPPRAAPAFGADLPLDAQLSAPGRAWLGGLVAHGRGASVFTTPTINGYRRYRPNALAPDRIAWGRDNRGAMFRLVGGAGDPGTRIENRAGEPAANPYLYIASQIASGLHGLEAGLEPPPSVDRPYEATAALLPTSLAEALVALDQDAVLRTAFGDPFVDYYSRIKRAEIARFDAEVTDWEQREYFDMF
ncbi:MAG: glutamine synthetase [Burkholderiaceae bacterium]|nr:glutamine synthetase [Burkholderiaceae bacterium]